MRHLVWLSAALTVAAMAAFPSEAEACGGMFCDSGPQPMPVDQTGENILFVMAEDYTEAHIQIQYDPASEAAEFAWIIPLTEVPEFAVSSDLMFGAVLDATVPSYGFTTTFTGEGCGGSSGNTGGGFTSGFPTTAASTSGGGSDSDSDSDGGPVVLFNDVVGAFEIAVLDGDNLGDINEWLDNNGYARDPAADPILSEYLAEGHIFAAFKLTNDTQTSEIHPIALRFSNNEACIPLRLTRIAAVDDMPVRAFFLADDRVVPETYRHVLVNPLRLNWPSRATNYNQVINEAVDADEANGRAFVTEYAGSSAVVGSNQILNPLWNAAPFETMEAFQVVEALADLGFVTRPDDFNPPTYLHPLIRGLLLRYLPVPAELGEEEFYRCVSCYEESIDLEAWDGPAFGAAVQERIIDPAVAAVDALDSFPTLTRMYTQISPHEMTADPMFYENPDLDAVDLRTQNAVQLVGCISDEVWVLPDGREVLAPDGIWPSFDDEMPWEEEVAEMMDVGAPVVLVNNSPTIAAELTEHNCAHNYPSYEACGKTPPPGDTDSGATSGFATDSGTDGAGLNDDGGCGCSSGPQPQHAAGLLGLLAFGLLRRRR